MADVISFPRQLRVVPPPEPIAADALPPVPLRDLVEHGGRSYRLTDLLGWLTPRERQTIEASAPLSGLQPWDEAVAGAAGGDSGWGRVVE